MPSTTVKERPIVFSAPMVRAILERAATPWQPKEQRTAKPKARRKRHHRERALF